MTFSFRRSDIAHNMLLEQLKAYLTTTHELREYMLYLESFPSKAACLIAKDCSEELSLQVLRDAKLEWKVVQTLEADTVASKTLRNNCIYVGFRCYREVMTCLEKAGFQVTAEVVETMEAWNPSFSQSSNLEQIFREMEHALKSGGNPQESLSNLSCVAVRALQRRICDAPDTPNTVQLADAGWCGKCVRGLKERLWSPAAAVPRN